ncbi:MAG: hypothetical protein AAGC74_12560 [Verrucomicrobiota bacterium]
MREVVLTEGLGWLGFVLLLVVVGGSLVSGWKQARAKAVRRRGLRICLQCNWREEKNGEMGRYGTCPLCGSVTQPGEGRKLG